MAAHDLFPKRVDFMTTFLRHTFVAAATVFAIEPSAALAAGECLVDDPTGTPLNVRSSPNGNILMTLGNGERVEVIDEMMIGAKRWLFISRQGERLGWAFGSFIVCKKGSEVREAPPSQPAEQR